MTSLAKIKSERKRFIQEAERKAYDLEKKKMQKQKAQRDFEKLEDDLKEARARGAAKARQTKLQRMVTDAKHKASWANKQYCSAEKNYSKAKKTLVNVDKKVNKALDFILGPVPAKKTRAQPTKKRRKTTGR